MKRHPLIKKAKQPQWQGLVRSNFNVIFYNICIGYSIYLLPLFGLSSDFKCIFSCLKIS